jgi:subtilisin family serine protease
LGRANHGLQVLQQSKIGYDSDIIACIEFARTNGARIINASMGGYSYSQSLSNAIYTACNDDILFVAACGNDGRDIDVTPYYPASYALDNIISVAFTTRKDVLGAQSNYGATNVDLAAPGAGLRSTFFVSDNSYLGGNYLFGTSLAAPYVSGALALAMARYPEDRAVDVRQRLLAGVDVLQGLSGKCATAGRLNLCQTLGPVFCLTAVPQSGGRAIELTVYRAPGQTSVIETTADLSRWSAVCTNITSGSGSFRHTWEPSPGNTAAFFRAVALP